MRRGTVTGGHGLRLGYAEYGPVGAPAVLVQHGLFGSAELGEAWTRRAEEHDVRLVAVERPGYGRSEPAPMAAVGDWAPIVTPLLARLDGPVDVVGVSAGAPYSYALAALAPQHVRAVWLLSGMPHVADEAVRGCYPEASLRAWRFFASGDADEVAASFADDHDRFVAAFAEYPHLVRALTEIADWGYAGPAREARLQVHPWGFLPADVACAVTAWHSRADEQVPWDAVARTLAMCRHAQLIEQSAPGHLPSDAVLDELFDALAAR